MKRFFGFLSFFFLLHLSVASAQTEFKSVKIGNQFWMGENLATKKFLNGDLIPYAKTREDWIKANNDCTPAWTYYEHNEEFAKKVGILYNWFAAIDARGLAPEGWRIPTVDDFTILSEFLGGDDVAGKKLKSKNDWFRNGHGDNSSGFNALGGGNRDLEGYFSYIVRVGLWWTIDEYDDSNAWYFYVDYGDDALKKYGAGKGMGMSIRCIKK